MPRPAGVADVRDLRRALRSRPSTVKCVVARLILLPNPQQTMRIGSTFVDPLPLYIRLLQARSTASSFLVEYLGAVVVPGIGRQSEGGARTCPRRGLGVLRINPR